ncbi:Uncharacterised protein [Vibrio cholerae]|nr:Uncharacterised protein [Vibrio cholerae]
MLNSRLCSYAQSKAASTPKLSVSAVTRAKGEGGR